MRWTIEMIDQLGLVPAGVVTTSVLAARLGVSVAALQQKASELNISLRLNDAGARNRESRKLRTRWEKLLPSMKEALRNDILRVSLDGPPPVVR